MPRNALFDFGGRSVTDPLERGAGPRGETVTLWRCQKCDWTQYVAPDEDFCVNCRLEGSYLTGPALSPSTALIVPEGSVGVVLSEEDIFVAHQVAKFFADRTGTGAGEWIAKLLAASDDQEMRRVGRAALGAEPEPLLARIREWAQQPRESIDGTHLDHLSGVSAFGRAQAEVLALLPEEKDRG